MTRRKLAKSGPVVLFQHKSGSVTAKVRGPRIGFLWTKVEYFRWVRSTKDPTAWERWPPNRECDQIHLERCVAAVRSWFRERDRR